MKINNNIPMIIILIILLIVIVFLVFKIINNKDKYELKDSKNKLKLIENKLKNKEHNRLQEHNRMQEHNRIKDLLSHDQKSRLTEDHIFIL